MKKNIVLILFALFFGGCGLGSPDADLQNAREKVESDATYLSKNSVIKVLLTKAKDTGDGLKSKDFYTLMVRLLLPITPPRNATHKSDFYFVLQLKNIKSSDKTLMGKYTTFVFGNLTKAKTFLIPQKNTVKPEVSIVNFNFIENHLFEITDYTKAYPFIKSTLPLEHTIYTITNEKEGCAMYCEGESAILGIPNDDERRSYTFKILLFDEKMDAMAKRDDEIWNLSLGVMAKNNKSLIFSKKSTVDMDFSIQNTFNEKTNSGFDLTTTVSPSPKVK